MEDDSLTMSVPEAGKLIGCGRALAYKLAREQKVIPVIKLGTRKLRVPKAALEKMLAEAGRKDNG